MVKTHIVLFIIVAVLAVSFSGGCASSTPTKSEPVVLPSVAGDQYLELVRRDEPSRCARGGRHGGRASFGLRQTQRRWPGRRLPV